MLEIQILAWDRHKNVAGVNHSSKHYKDHILELHWEWNVGLKRCHTRGSWGWQYVTWYTIGYIKAKYSRIRKSTTTKNHRIIILWKESLNSNGQQFYQYSETCLNWTPLGLKTLFSLDRCLVYSGFGLQVSLTKWTITSQLKS